VSKVVRLLKKKTDLNPNLRMVSIERRRFKYGRAWDGRCLVAKRKKESNLNPNLRMMSMGCILNGVAFVAEEVPQK